MLLNVLVETLVHTPIQQYISLKDAYDLGPINVRAYNIAEKRYQSGLIIYTEKFAIMFKTAN